MKRSFCSPKNFIKKIENPINKKLKDLLKEAKKNAKDVFNEKDKSLIKKLSYTFYPPRSKNPEFMLILQNPGKYKKDNKSDKDEKNEIKAVFRYPEKLSEFFNIALEDWLFKKNETFMLRFLEIINNSRKSKITEKNFLEYMYFTDLVKYRAGTEDIKIGKKENAEASFDEFIKAEIEELKPKLIFTFSTRTWEIIKRKMNPKLVNKNIKYSNLSAVTNAHGFLYKSQNSDIYIIPLVHFSRRNFFLRNSYFDYMKEGVDTYYRKTRKEY